MKSEERMRISMLNGVTMKVNVDDYIINTLKEDITSEDVSTNAVMPEDKNGKAQLICKQSGILCGLDVFVRTFRLLDENSYFETEFKDGVISVNLASSPRTSTPFERFVSLSSS